MSSSASSVSSSSSVASEPFSERPMALFAVVFFGCGRGSEAPLDSFGARVILHCSLWKCRDLLLLQI